VDRGGQDEATYPVDISILAFDRSGLSGDITSVPAGEKINVIGVNTHSDKKDHAALMLLTVEIEDPTELSDAKFSGFQCRYSGIRDSACRGAIEKSCVRDMPIYLLFSEY
jgi:hypothetical protein